MKRLFTGPGDDPDEYYFECDDCEGTGKVNIPVWDEEEESFESLSELSECPGCGGLGYIAGDADDVDG